MHKRILTLTAAALLATSASAQTKLTLWTHSAGNEGEMKGIKGFVDGFNKSQKQYTVSIEAFPQASYNDSVTAASVAGSLPCILDMDGPTVPNFAWSGYIQPLTLSQDLISQISSANVGRFQNKVYSVGQFDVALTIYALKSVLLKNKIRIPTTSTPWTLAEFNAALSTLKASGQFDYALDVNPGYTGEWSSYAYSPMLQSFGGDLIDRKTYLSAEGALNGPKALAWGKWFQSLFTNKYVNPTPADDQGFLQGKVGLWYSGSWAANDVVKKYGSDALFLRVPNLGTGSKIGGASWQWGVSKSCKSPAGANAFLNYIMQPRQIATMSDITGLIPTTRGAAALTANYKVGGKYRAFFDMTKNAVLRPQTPAYLVISSQFEKAVAKLRDGGDVQNALDDAVDAINKSINDNKGYGFKK